MNSRSPLWGVANVSTFTELTSLRGSLVNFRPYLTVEMVGFAIVALFLVVLVVLVVQQAAACGRGGGCS